MTHPEFKFEPDLSAIPSGLYCHAEDDMTRICPYWSKSLEHPYQENGYCALLGEGDWDEPGRGLSLLWDQVKECGLKDEISEEDLA